MDALPLTGNAPRKSEVEYHGKFGHNLVRIQHIAILNRIGICYKACFIGNQNMALTLPGLQGLKSCIQYLNSRPHKPILYPYNSYGE